MEERYIASVDLGSSKIAVGVAKVVGKDIQVIYYKENSSAGIRNSYVFNPGKLGNVLRQHLSDVQQELKIKVQQVVVGLPRYFIREETASASMDREDQNLSIQESEVSYLKSMALESYPLDDARKEVIYGAVAQSFSTEDNLNEVESDIIGMTAEKLEGKFKVFIGDRRSSANIDTVFKGLGIGIAKKYFTPGITAKAVLRDEQMENGVALIDIGAGVSSVTIFKGKIMRYYASIPFGGDSITKDISNECNITPELAENIKKAYGACMPNRLSALGEKTLQINDDSGQPPVKVRVKYISEIITCRMKEIVEALLYLIEKSGYSSEDKLRAGIVLTGGGSELVNCANYIKEMSGYSVKTACPRSFFTCDGCLGAKEASAATTMGMILAASHDPLLNCTSRPQIPLPKPETAKKPAYPYAKPKSETAAPNQETEYDPTHEITYVEQKPVEQESVSAIEDTVIAGREDDETNVFEQPTQKEIEEYKERKKKEKKEKKKTIKWDILRRIGSKITESVDTFYDEMGKEDV